MYARSVKRRRRGMPKIVGVIFWLGLAALLVLAVIKIPSWLGSSDHISNLSQKINSIAPTPTPTPPLFVPLDVEARWQTVLDQYPDVKVSLELRDVNSDLVASHDSQTAYRAASTAKLIVATYFLHQVEQGKYTLTQPMSGYTTGFHLQQMINQSNNNSWAAFMAMMGRANEEQFAHDMGWTSFVIATNYLAPTDLADLLQRLKKGELLNAEHTQLLLGYMQNTINERLIPPGLPEGAVVYHKYGQLEDDYHDASIITWKGHDYVLVIMSNGNGVAQYTRREAMFHALVEATFNQSQPTPTPSAQ